MWLLVVISALLLVLGGIGVASGWLKVEVRVPIKLPGGGGGGGDSDSNTGSLGGLAILAGAAFIILSLFRK